MTARPAEWRNHWDRTCRAERRRPKDLRKHQIISWHIYQSGNLANPSMRLRDSSEPRRESDYPQMDQTWNGGQRSQEQPAPLNDCRDAAMTRPGGQKKKKIELHLKNWIYNTAKIKLRLSVKVKGCNHCCQGWHNRLLGANCFSSWVIWINIYCQLMDWSFQSGISGPHAAQSVQKQQKHTAFSVYERRWMNTVYFSTNPAT